MRKINKDSVILWDSLLLLVAIFWGGGFVVTKSALSQMTPMYFLAFRFLLSFFIMLLIFHKKLLNINLRIIKISGIIGAFLFLGFASQTIGLLYTTPGKQAFITGTNVIIVPFLYMMISKKFPGWHSIVGAFLATLGLGFLSLELPFYINLGDALTLACAVFFAFHIVLVGKYASVEDPVTLSILQIGIACILCLITAIAFEPSPSSIGDISIMPLLYTILLSTIAAFLIQNIAQSHTPPTHAAIILCLESVFGFFFSYIIGYEILTLQVVIGSVLILLGIVVTEAKIGSKKRKTIKSR